jgi:hypothetical protein
MLVFQLTPALAKIASWLTKLGVATIYFNPAGSTRHPETMARLSRMGVQQIDYTSFAGFDAYARHKILARWSAAAVDSLFPAQVADSASEMLPKVQDRVRKFRALVNEAVMQSLGNYATVGAVAEYLRAKDTRCLIWPIGGVLSSILFARFSQLPTVLPAVIVSGWVAFLKACGVLLRSLGWRMNNAAPISPKVPGSESSHCPYDAAVLLFPHQGLNYGDLYAKDQYYAADPASPFAQNRICHIEIAGIIPDQLHAQVMAGYRSAGVAPDILWMPHETSKRRWLSAIRSGKRLGLGLLASIVLEIVRSRVVRGMAALERFPNAKLALLGYEFLFPAWLAYALQARGIRVAATQERLMQAFVPGCTLILDEYFVHGNAAGDLLARNQFACIGKVHSVGDVRAAELFNVRERVDEFRSEYRHITLVLDWHSEPDRVQDAQHVTNNWANNRLFYEDIIALARQFPSHYFLLRGKNADWFANPAFADIRQQVEMLPNISVSMRYDKPLISYDLAASSDSVIARYTSLGDQCLAVGKPLIYYDCAVNGGPLVRSLLDFDGHPVLISDRAILAERYSRLVSEGSLLPKEQQSAFLRRYFSAPLQPGAPKAAVAARLEMLLQ